MFCCIPKIQHSLRENLEANRRSRSLMILLGRPNLVKMCVMYRAAICSLEISSRHGMNMNTLEQSWSVIVRMESYPSDSGSLVIKSMATTSNGVASSLAYMGCNGARVGQLFTLFLWHSVQPFTYSATSLRRFSHHVIHSTSCTVWVIPGCPCTGVSWCLLIISRILLRSPVCTLLPCLYHTPLTFLSLWGLTYGFSRFSCWVVSDVVIVVAALTKNLSGRMTTS